MADTNEKYFANVVHVQQGTKKWFEARKGTTGICVGSSLLGAIAGLSQFKTSYEAYKQIVTGKNEPTNAAMIHGNKFEGTCAKNFERISKCPNLHEAGVAFATPKNPNFTKEQKPFYAGSIDRWGCDCGENGDDIKNHMNHEGFFVVECKCPFTRSSFDEYYGSILVLKHEHLCQLHLQMALFNLKHIFYTAALIKSSDGTVQISKAYEVLWSEEYWQYVMQRAHPVVKCAVHTHYTNEMLSYGQVVEEIVKSSGNGGDKPPAVIIKELW